MDFASAVKIFDQIAGSNHAASREELFTRAFRYARIRADWYTLSSDDRHRVNDARTAAHNALIGSCDKLSRIMDQSGEDTSWRKMLGEDRITIGDFACYLHCILGLKSK